MKKTYLRFLSFLLCCVTVLGMLSLTVSADGEITSASVTGVTVPTAGSTPVFQATAPADAPYTVEQVQWYLWEDSLTALSAGDRFEAGKTYQVHVTLKAKDGAAFAVNDAGQPQVSGQINGESCLRVESVSGQEPTDSIKLIYDFDVITPVISRVAITGLTVPIQNAIPDTSFSVGDSTYRVDKVVWIYLNPPAGAPQEMGANDRFAGDGQYRLHIVLAAEGGASFASAGNQSTVTGTINGSSAACTALDGMAASDYIALEAVYTVEKTTAITQVAVTGLTVPEKDGKPDFLVNAAANALYTVEQVAWRGWNPLEGADSFTELTANDTFLPGYSYQVAILLKAKSGAAFFLDDEGKPQVTATVDGKAAHPGAAVNGKEPNQYILIGLDFAIEAEKTPIDQVIITDVTQPSIGKKPIASAKVPEDALYTVDKVIWKRWDIFQSVSDPVPMGSRDTFEPDSTYQVTVILKAKDEAAFTLDRFDRPQVTATLNENPTNPPSAVEGKDPAQYICISYNFRTAADLITSVSILELDEPVKGKLPDLKIEVPPTALYEIEDIIWQYRDPETPSARYTKMGFSDIFENDKEYQICVVLKAKEDAEFSTNTVGQPQVTAKFNGDPAKPASAVKDMEPAQYIQVTFEFLLESDIKTVEHVDVDELDPPVAGSKPDQEANVSFVAKYTVHQITWERLQNGKATKLDKNDTFRAGENYRVNLVLKAKEDAAFAVSSTGRTQVNATLNGETVPVSVVSGKDPAEYIGISYEFTIYTVIEGDDAQWTPAKGNLRFRFSGETKDFTGIKVDGGVVDKKFYTVTDGSVVIQLDGSYLAALKDGIHELTVVYSNGTATTNFEVYNDGSAPPSQEESSSGGGWWILIIPLCIALLCGAIALSVFLRKKGWL